MHFIILFSKESFAYVYLIVLDKLWKTLDSIVKGVQTLSGQSNFDIIEGKIGQTWNVKVFSWAQMMHNSL